MPEWKDQVIEDWWPLGQAMILVRAPVKTVAIALGAEVNRLEKKGRLECPRGWVAMRSLDELFRGTETFTISPTHCYALPTKTRWTVLWNNEFARWGDDSLAHRLTIFHALETVSFCSSDRTSTQLAGTHVTFRRPTGDENPTRRNVYCCSQGSRWHFEQHGEPLPEEDLERYERSPKRERLNEQGLMELLERLGAAPWRESAYDFSQPCFRIQLLPDSVTQDRYTWEDILKRVQGAKKPPDNQASDEDQELTGPPGYLQQICQPPRPDGPSRLLADGAWCGHGERTYWVFDLRAESDRFTVRLPEDAGPPVVMVRSVPAGSTFEAYDSRRHPVSPFFESKIEPRFQPNERCPRCGGEVFYASVGFEVPPDAEESDETTWFALALQCAACGTSRVVYDDKT